MQDLAILKLEQVSFKFSPDSASFFKDLTIEFRAKRLNFIQGKNGVGKSTFCRIIQRHFYPHEKVNGVLIYDQERCDLGAEDSTFTKKYSVGSVHQQVSLMLADQATFEENLQYAKFPTYPTLSSLSPITLVPHFVYSLGIDFKKPVHRLSGGQKQILAILMVLQKPCSILVLDEPTAALDEQNAFLLIAFLRNLVETTNIIIIIISHDQLLMDKAKPISSFYVIEIDTFTQHRTIRLVA